MHETDISIEVNGRQRRVAADCTLADLLGQLKLDARQVAVELNTQLVPRGEHAKQILHPGDQLEIVTLVGGG